jgi:hypothetical protein
VTCKLGGRNLQGWCEYAKDACRKSETFVRKLDLVALNNHDT